MLGIIYCIGFVITFTITLYISLKYIPEYGYKNFYYSVVTATVFPVFWIRFLFWSILHKKG